MSEYKISAEVENGWNSTFTSLWNFMACTGIYLLCD